MRTQKPKRKQYKTRKVDIKTALKTEKPPTRFFVWTQGGVQTELAYDRATLQKPGVTWIEEDDSEEHDWEVVSTVSKQCQCRNCGLYGIITPLGMRAPGIHKDESTLICRPERLLVNTRFQDGWVQNIIREGLPGEGKPQKKRWK